VRSLESVAQVLRHALRTMRSRRGHATVGILSLALGLGAGTGRGQEHEAPLNLNQAREILAHGAPNQALGPISLQGLNYSREIDIGKGLRVLVLSKNMSGGLILFSRDGVAKSFLATEEITSLQIFDLNEDGVSELITEEIEGRGTGVLVKNFKVYKFDAEDIKEIWKGQSYSLSAPWNPDNKTQRVHETQSFLRFDRGIGGAPSRMTYLEPLDHTGRFRKTEYSMIEGAIRTVPESKLSR
jgi:hypothetical protein